MVIAAEPPLVGGVIDRDAPTRFSDDALDAAWAEPGCGLLLWSDGLVPIRDETEGAALSLVPVRGAREPDAVYLGRDESRPVFTTAIPEGSEPPAGATWAHPFAALMGLSPGERELITMASAVHHWHDNAGFSPRTGEPTDSGQGGWARLDPHGVELFPRTDPAVIVLIEHENRVLLGSNVLWETGRFSLLAGFIEAGESAEQAVRREVFEEAGARLEAIEYVVSQPWPFPRSLMLGFRARLAARADPEDLVADPEEISELRWFTREELRDPGPGLLLPMPVSIARWLIDRWVEEGDVGAEP